MRRAFGFMLLVAGIVGLILRLSLAHRWGQDPVMFAAGAIVCAVAGLFMLFAEPVALSAPSGDWLFRWRVARACALAVIIILLLMAISVFVYSPPRADRSGLIALLFASALSGAVGYAELTERYRDDPARLFTADPTIIYVCVNIAAAVGALALVREFAVFDDTNPHRAIYEVLLASFGSIAFFRSSLFTARVAGEDVDVGPSTLLKSLLETSDRMINRSQARDRADDAAAIMARVEYAKACAALPAFCLTAVENVTKEDQDRIGADIAKLTLAPDMSDPQRSILLGIYLMRVVGPHVLARAVNALGTTIAVSK
jgi:hypothetical protein